MARKRKRWTYSAGRRPYTVAVEELEPGGNIYVRIWSRREQRHRYRSLRHRDRDRAIEHAEKLALRLREEGEAVLAGNVTWDRVIRLYRQHRTPQKSPGVRKDDDRRTELFTRFLGPRKDPHAISLAEWEKFIHQRRGGIISPRGKPVAEGKRRPVRIRTVEADLRWLKAVLNWGANWKTGDNRYLLRENPVRGFEFPKEKNPRRPIATQERYEKIKAVADQVMMEVEWDGDRKLVRSHLTEIFEIVNGTGRRISAICQLRYEDLRLEQGPHGSIRWPADTDKMGRESIVPITAEARAVINRILEERPGIGTAPLFPAPRDPSEPVRYELASDWLQEAEKLASVEPQKGTLWHAYRRKWATERKHLSDVDVAAAGGWSNPRTLTEIYQQPDQDSMYRVVSEPAKLREA